MPDINYLNLCWAPKLKKLGKQAEDLHLFNDILTATANCLLCCLNKLYTGQKKNPVNC